MKRFLVLAVLVLALPLHGRADDASKRAKLDELFTLMKLDKMMSQMMDLGMQQANGALNSSIGSEMPPAIKAHFDDYMKKVRAVVAAELEWKSIEPEYINLYADNFTEAQVDDLLAFYKSPAGQALLEKTPVITQQSMQLAQARMMKVIPKIKTLADEFAKEAAADAKNSQTKAKATGSKKL